MTDETTDGRPLDEWLDALDLILDRLRDSSAPEGFPFDFSPASLARLEALVLDRYQPGGPRPEGTGPFIESAMAYLGETLMRVGGGHWAFGPHPSAPTVEVPIVCPDDALGLPPVSPLAVIIDAIRERGGDVFLRARADLDRAVTRRRAADPAWSPTKEPSIAADAVPVPPTDYLVHWLATRERSFDRWVRDEAGGTDALDFSRGSLRVLHALVRRRMPGGEAAFDKPEHQEFVDGGAWYLGEVAVRTTHAVWQYRDGDPAVNPLAGTPYLETFGPRGNMLFPVAALMAAAGSDEPGYLDKTLARFA